MVWFREVGFRFYILYSTLASSYKLTGFAKNLTAGDVQF